MEMEHENLKRSLEKLHAMMRWAKMQEESEKIKGYLRALQRQYPAPIGLEELRKQLDKQLGSQELSEFVRQMRAESEH